jgi:hypothetical protein
MRTKTRFTIAQAVELVADALRDSQDRTPTTIRCAINDTLDAAQKDGYSVHDAYDQPRAVRAVRRLLGMKN